MRSLIKRSNNPVRNRLWDPLFEDFFSAPSVFGNWMENGITPKVDIHDTKDHLILDFEIPGMEKDGIKVMVKENVLTVSGSREVKNESEEDSCIRREISTGSFSRQFSLPKSVKVDSIKADYKNGILHVTFDKVEEAKPKEIEVKIS